MKTRTYLQLVRAPAAFSAASNIIAAQFIASGGSPDWGTVALLCVVSVSLYSAGMVMNDCVDVETDRKERPDRPLPSGEVSLRRAWTLVAVLVTVAMVAAILAGTGPTAIALILLVAIWLYNVRAKQGPFGPVVMGACRYLNWMLGLSTFDGAVTIWLAVPLPVFIYIWSVTTLGRDEVEVADRANAVLSGIGVLLAAALIPVVGDPSCTRCGLYFAAVLIWLLPLVPAWWLMVTDYSSGNVQQMMRFLILAMIPLDALILVSFGYLVPALLVLGLLLPSWYLSRIVYVT